MICDRHNLQLEICLVVLVVVRLVAKKMEFTTTRKFLDGAASTPHRPVRRSAQPCDASGTPPEFWMPAGRGGRGVTGANGLGQAAIPKHRDKRTPLRQKIESQTVQKLEPKLDALSNVVEQTEAEVGRLVEDLHAAVAIYSAQLGLLGEEVVRLTSRS